MSTYNPPDPFRVRLAAHEPPPGWKLLEVKVDGEAYIHRHFTLIVSTEVRDGQWWMHMSLSRKDRLPTWLELMEAKEWAMGRNVYAYAVAPPLDRLCGPVA